MSYVLWVFAAVVGLPCLFPSVFFRKAGRSESRAEPKLIYFEVHKPSENPWMDQPIGVSVYQEDTERYAILPNAHDDEAFDEMRGMLFKSISDRDAQVYFVTYDEAYATVCYKTLFEDLFEELEIEPRFIDLKQLFYYTHPSVEKIEYDDLREYFRVPDLSHRVVEFSAVLHQLLEDLGPNNEGLGEKLSLAYAQINS